MTTKKTKTLTGKFNEIKLFYVAKADDFIDIRANVSEDMAEFFNKHQKTLLPHILPLLVVMETTKQPLFIAKFTVGDKHYTFNIEERAAPDTTLN